MENLRIVPSTTLVVFPGMPVTLPWTSARDTHVLLLPRRRRQLREAWAWWRRSRSASGSGASTRSCSCRCTARCPGRGAADEAGVLRVEVEERPDVRAGPGADPRAGARVPRGGGRDPRAARRRRAHPRLRAVDHRPRLAGRHRRLLSRLEPRAEAPAAGDARRGRAPDPVRCSSSASAWPSCRCASASATTSRTATQKQQREYILRKQMEAIRKELGETDGPVADEYRKKIDEAGMPDAVREQARARAGPARAHGRPERGGGHHPHLPRLAAVGALGQALRGAPRPGARPRGARRRPRGARRREEPHHRVPGRAQAARGARLRGHEALRRHPHPDRAARNRQDLDRRVDRPRHRTAVRAHVAGRRARRGGDPRPPPHLRRRPARAAWCARCATRAR